VLDDIGVEMDDTGLGMANVAMTTAKYPFVSHVCCDACLADPESPSGKLNSEFEVLTADVDPGLHQAIIKVSGLVSELDNSESPDTIFTEVEKIHHSLLQV
ncbi:MAG TPA: hypothetical protein VGN01_19815, partial [Acidobacteriaceae bacterium]